MTKIIRFNVKSGSSSNTEQIAYQIGQNLRGGEVIELSSDLGGGKTVFVKGLAQGAGSKEDVTSPTFTISKIYTCPKFLIHHFDFFRLKDPGIVALELVEVLQDPKAVVVIEWASTVKNILPSMRMDIVIEPGSKTNRLLKFSMPQALSYLIQGLTR